MFQQHARGARGAVGPHGLDHVRHDEFGQAVAGHALGVDVGEHHDELLTGKDARQLGLGLELQGVDGYRIVIGELLQALGDRAGALGRRYQGGAADAKQHLAIERHGRGLDLEGQLAVQRSVFPGRSVRAVQGKQGEQAKSRYRGNGA